MFKKVNGEYLRTEGVEWSHCSILKKPYCEGEAAFSSLLYSAKAEAVSNTYM